MATLSGLTIAGHWLLRAESQGVELVIPTVADVEAAIATHPSAATGNQCAAMMFFLKHVIPCVAMPWPKGIVDAYNLTPVAAKFWLTHHYELAFAICLMEAYSNNPHAMTLRDRPRLRFRYYSLCDKYSEIQLSGGLHDRLEAWTRQETEELWLASLSP